MSSIDPFAGAGVTALGLAASRSVESSRTDRLLDDPYARSFFERAGDRLPMRVEWPGAYEEITDTEALHLHGSRYIGVRTRFYDDQVIEAAAAGIRQVVLLGAGLDTRAHRLALPDDTTIYELDRPDLLEWKTATLAAISSRSRYAIRAVDADLADTVWTQSLDQAGFDPDHPTLWIAEGALPYLDSPAHTALVTAVSSLSAPGSELHFDQITGGDTRELSERSGLDMSSLLASTDGARAATAALDAGDWTWNAQPVTEVAAHYRRDLADPFTSSGDAPAPPPWLDTVFVSAAR